MISLSLTHDPVKHEPLPPVTDPSGRLAASAADAFSAILSQGDPSTTLPSAPARSGDPPPPALPVPTPDSLLVADPAILVLPPIALPAPEVQFPKPPLPDHVSVLQHAFTASAALPEVSEPETALVPLPPVAEIARPEVPPDPRDASPTDDLLAPPAIPLPPTDPTLQALLAQWPMYIRQQLTGLQAPVSMQGLPPTAAGTLVIEVENPNTAATFLPPAEKPFPDLTLAFRAPIDPPQTTLKGADIRPAPFDDPGPILATDTKTTPFSRTAEITSPHSADRIGPLPAKLPIVPAPTISDVPRLETVDQTAQPPQAAPPVTPHTDLPKPSPQTQPLPRSVTTPPPAMTMVDAPAPLTMQVSPRRTNVAAPQTASAMRDTPKTPPPPPAMTMVDAPAPLTVQGSPRRTSVAAPQTASAMSDTPKTPPPPPTMTMVDAPAPLTVQGSQLRTAVADPQTASAMRDTSKTPSAPPAAQQLRPKSPPKASPLPDRASPDIARQFPAGPTTPLADTKAGPIAPAAILIRGEGTQDVDRARISFLPAALPSTYALSHSGAAQPSPQQASPSPAEVLVIARFPDAEPAMTPRPERSAPLSAALAPPLTSPASQPIGTSASFPEAPQPQGQSTLPLPAETATLPLPPLAPSPGPTAPNQRASSLAPLDLPSHPSPGPLANTFTKPTAESPPAENPPVTVRPQPDHPPAIIARPVPADDQNIPVLPEPLVRPAAETPTPARPAVRSANTLPLAMQNTSSSNLTVPQMPPAGPPPVSADPNPTPPVSRNATTAEPVRAAHSAGFAVAAPTMPPQPHPHPQPKTADQPIPPNTMSPMPEPATQPAPRLAQASLPQDPPQNPLQLAPSTARFHSEPARLPSRPVQQPVPPTASQSRTVAIRDPSRSDFAPADAAEPPAAATPPHPAAQPVAAWQSTFAPPRPTLSPAVPAPQTPAPETPAPESIALQRLPPANEGPSPPTQKPKPQAVASQVQPWAFPPRKPQPASPSLSLPPQIPTNPPPIPNPSPPHHTLTTVLPVPQPRLPTAPTPLSRGGVQIPAPSSDGSPPSLNRSSTIPAQNLQPHSDPATPPAKPQSITAAFVTAGLQTRPAQIAIKTLNQPTEHDSIPRQSPDLPRDPTRPMAATDLPTATTPPSTTPPSTTLTSTTLPASLQPVTPPPPAMLSSTSVTDKVAPHLTHRLPHGVPAALARGAARARTDDRVELTLDPVELGKVRFDFTTTNDRITINLSVERPETLDLLRRHADTLRSEFREAGFDGSSLSFSQWSQQGQDKSTAARLFAIPEGEDFAPAAPDPTPTRTNTATGLGLDLRL